MGHWNTDWLYKGEEVPFNQRKFLHPNYEGDWILGNFFLAQKVWESSGVDSEKTNSLMTKALPYLENFLDSVTNSAKKKTKREQ